MTAPVEADEWAAPHFEVEEGNSVLYVSANQAQTNADGSESNPFPTLQAAVEVSSLHFAPFLLITTNFSIGSQFPSQMSFISIQIPFITGLPHSWSRTHHHPATRGNTLP